MDYLWTERHAEFVASLFVRLNTLQIDYFVLRNYEGLPLNNPGKDVDIVIRPGYYKDVEQILLGIIKSQHIKYYTVSKFDNMRCWYIMDIDNYLGLHIDIIENEIYKGFEIFDFDFFYNNTMQYNDITVLKKPLDMMMLLAQNLIAYQSLKPRYRKSISTDYLLYKQDVDYVLKMFWGEKTADLIIRHIEKNDYDGLVEISARLRRVALWRIFRRKPFRSILGCFRFLSGRIYRIIWCPRKLWRFIAIEAPDGAGKTTFINNLVEMLRVLYVSDSERFVVRHFRPELFPNLGAVAEKANISKQDKDFSKPHRGEHVGIISSFIRMTYYWIDYIIGIPYLLRKDVHYERYTIFDRYAFDFLVDPERSKIFLPVWVRRLFVRLIQKPNLVFILDADSDIIYDRKQELSREEINRQLQEYRKLLSLGNCYVRIDANKSEQEMVRQAIPFIMNSFMTKVEFN